ncbi:MAG: hypothetical protein IPM39_29370 [Chloroflexi bacterium]|nr:hypothetical protein [Chloroflexota bacterium]
MPRRDFSNLALWLLEDTYAALQTIERDIATLMGSPAPTRDQAIITLARVRVTAVNARLRITEAHPTVRDKVAKRK